MAEDAGNRGLFCDLAGKLVKMDDTRQLPLGPDGKIVVELLPGVGHTPMMEDPQATGTLLLEFAAAAAHPH